MPTPVKMQHIYIEPTSHCNLNCEMCSRKQWKNETIGHMNLDVFEKLLSEIPSSVTKVTFGGIGEPLVHPNIKYMIAKVKSLGLSVEIITNGILLTEDMSKSLVDSQINTIWISIDSLDSNEYSSIRIGGDIYTVFRNIKGYNRARDHYTLRSADSYDQIHAQCKLGISFILMKKNLSSFKSLVEKAYFYGIDEIKATHLIPYDEESEEQVCYRRLLDAGLYGKHKASVPHVDLPLLEVRAQEGSNLFSLFDSPLSTFSILGDKLERNYRYCRFVNEGCAFVRWDGVVSPCMALLHDNQVYQNRKIRKISHCGFGNINDMSLEEIYDSIEYSEFRGRVIDFSFSHCVDCASCDLFLDNQTDCSGNIFPTCGGCLWSEGLFQCP